MSQGYAVDYYGIATYGYSQPLDYSVAPFSAIQRNYNSLTLTWKPISNKPWKILQLVRSLYGYPSVPDDGELVTSFTPAYGSTSYEDINLLPGRIYYYTMFLGLEAQTWSSGTTYSVNDVVLYNGQYWLSLFGSNTANTPAVGSSFWSISQYAPTWYPAGYTASLVVNDYGYSQYLYDRVPQPYKITSSDVFTNKSVDNPELLHYLSIFGFHLDMTRTEYDLYLQGNNPDLVGASNLDWLGKELGITTNYLTSPQNRRERVKNAALNYQLKGTPQGIHNAVADITGWDCDVTTGYNMMLNNDQSKFAHPAYNAWNDTIVYFVNDLVSFNGYNYKCLVQAQGAAQAPTGTSSANTWWTPQISGTSTQIIDTVALRNPKAYSAALPAFSTWSNGFDYVTIENTATLDGIVTGLPHPTDITINNINALGYHLSGSLTPGSPTFYGVNAISVAHNYIPSWSNATNYVVNNYVTTGTGLFFIAVKPSGPGSGGAVTPGTDERVWKPVSLGAVTSSAFLISNTIPDSIPLPATRTWDATTTYNAGDQVAYFGIVYQAIRTNTNSVPSGYYYSTKDWIFLQPYELNFSTSAYTARLLPTNNTAQTGIDLEFTTESLNTLTPASGAAISANTALYVQNFLDRFLYDYTDLNGVNDSTLASTGTYQWQSTAKLWTSSYGMAAVNQSVAGTATYSTLRVSDGRSDVKLYTTFVTDYVDTAHYGHGILFRYQDANNFWYTTRKSLYLVSGGTETLMASWTRLANEDRMIVILSGSSIGVYKYARDGLGSAPNLALITNSTLQTATIHGLIQKYSPTGAV